MNFLWIFDPDGIYTLPLWTALLWALGGSGVLMLRRFGVALIVGLAAASHGIPWWVCAFTSIFLYLTSTFSYGEKDKEEYGDMYFLYVYMVGFCYGASLLFLAIHGSNYILIWLAPIVIGAFFSGLMYLSQRFDFPKHKYVEMLVGYLIGHFAMLVIL